MPGYRAGGGSRFNGATAFRRRKRALYAFVPVRALCSFNGATAFRRRKRMRSGVGRLDVTCFNGATAFRRRKPHKPAGHRRAAAGFNGATAFRRRKRLGGEPPPPPLAAGFNGATAFRRRKLSSAWIDGPANEQASMGPPPFGGGNATIGGSGATRTALQWGHRLSAAETGPGSSRCGSPQSCFNGATAFRRRKLRRGHTGLTRSVCFNGATAFRRRKRSLWR